MEEMDNFKTSIFDENKEMLSCCNTSLGVDKEGTQEVAKQKEHKKIDDNPEELLIHDSRRHCAKIDKCIGQILGYDLSDRELENYIL